MCDDSTAWNTNNSYFFFHLSYFAFSFSFGRLQFFLFCALGVCTLAARIHLQTSLPPFVHSNVLFWICANICRRWNETVNCLPNLSTTPELVSVAVVCWHALECAHRALFRLWKADEWNVDRLRKKKKKKNVYVVSVEMNAVRLPLRCWINCNDFRQCTRKSNQFYLFLFHILFVKALCTMCEHCPVADTKHSVACAPGRHCCHIAAICTHKK